MRNTLLIIKREFITRVQKKSFIIFSLLAPFLFALSIFIYTKIIFNTSVSAEALYVKIADNTQWVGKSIADAGVFRFESIDPEPLETLRDKYADTETIILYIEGEKDGYPVNYSMFSTKTVSMDLQQYVRQVITSTVEGRKLKEYDIEDLDRIMSEIRTPVNMRTIKWEKDVEDRESNTSAIMGISYVLALILYMFIIMFGSMVMRGVVEEKTSRIIEIMISSVKPFQLMTGKIIGIAMVAISQFVIWIVLTAVFTAVFQNTSGSGGEIIDGLLTGLSGINILEILGYFFLYFIGGYLLYASMFAAVGSAVESEADSQQLMTPIMIPLILAIMIMVQTFRNPDSSLSVWASMIPFTSPVVMIGRVPFGVPVWQIILSLAILFATFILTSFITSKIYRTGILMHGKKPSLKEIVKWLKYK